MAEVAEATTATSSEETVPRLRTCLEYKFAMPALASASPSHDAA